MRLIFFSWLGHRRRTVASGSSSVAAAASPFPINFSHHSTLRADKSNAGNGEWSRILWSMAKTGLVPLKKSNIAAGLMSSSGDGDDDDSDNTLQSSSGRESISLFNLGGVAEARRRPGGPTTANQTRKRKPNLKNRKQKPIRIVQEDDDDDPDEDHRHYYVKKKQSSAGLPWFFNLMGPPGIIK